ncbi:cation:proton antiporter [Candidatus Aminicenantes bacterium AC-335-A11]|jgi:Kef-type K+ transport system membrane component KefB|nr:cation:proton antiporter [SCandidatus Aminicenantes bacterium Aminicenantia_JdfR_composite]MCP2598429.1 cation:proton antiporter [Candidatus Aminicenantes bacterium AC-335-L06]MCP2618431.1 cation:proton antiporter [Candidatus Aminicenantes bacterium AC-335-A11]
MKFWKIFLIILLIVGFALFSFPSQGNKETENPISQVLIGLIVILFIAKVGGYLAERIGQPAVLGELIAGIIIGNLALFTGWEGVNFLRFNEHIEILAELGIIILLFEVGLRENVRNMLKVGFSSSLVALIGVVFPFLFGYFSSQLMLTGKPSSVYIFIGATLTATSVGITARVLQDLGKISTNEGRIILGAAVIDDVLGLIILAVVTGIVTSGAVSFSEVSYIILKAVIFLIGAIFLGVIFAPKILKLAQRLWIEGIMLVSALLFAFLLSYLANKVGLASIVGAFAAGLILEEAHFKGFKETTYTIGDMIRPISSFLVPIFFVLMGVQVRIETFKELHVIWLSLVLTVVAIIGKQLCGLGAIGKNLNRISIGLGMMPRGEVGLIFAAIGRKLTIPGTNIPVIDHGTYSAVVIMVILTTLITPPLLKYSFLPKKATKP